MTQVKCPQCAEKIQSEAKICRFCGHVFPLKQQPPPLTPAAQAWSSGCAVIVMLGVFLILGKACSSASAPPISNDTEVASAPSGPDPFEIKVGAEEQLKTTLKDSDSVKFRNEFASSLDNGGMVLCGEVNAKNSFGGYTGFKRFIASPNPEAPTLMEGETTGLGDKIDRTLFPEAWKRFCSNPKQNFN